MKALITGANGTVGSRLGEHLRRQGVEVHGWDRARVPSHDEGRMHSFVQSVAPDVLFHLAIASKPTGRPNEGWHINFEWTSTLARISHQQDIRFVFSSTAMVYSNEARGPFTPSSPPDAQEGYGYEKRRAEEEVFHQNPQGRVVRLGWQMDEVPQGNNMVAALDTQMRESGRVEASTRWYPACSFLDDTVAALQRASIEAPGLYLVDSNERWTHYEIACALNVRRGNPWRVVPTSHFTFDQRMQDARLGVPSLKQRLSTLP